MGSRRRPPPWGRREFDAATAALRSTGYLGALKAIIGVMCLSVVGLGIIVQFHPMAPQGLHLRVVHGAAVASAAVVGLCWIRRPWPSHRAAVLFVIWADLAIAVGAVVMSEPAAQLNTTSHLGLIGVFVALLLGWQILALHCVFATAVIVGLTASAVLGGRATCSTSSSTTTRHWCRSSCCR